MTDLDAWIDAMSDVLDLPVAAEHRAGTRRFLAAAAAMAATLDAVPLDEAELANLPVYLPPEGGA